MENINKEAHKDDSYNECIALFNKLTPDEAEKAVRFAKLLKMYRAETAWRICTGLEEVST